MFRASQRNVYDVTRLVRHVYFVAQLDSGEPCPAAGEAEVLKAPEHSCRLGRTTPLRRTIPTNGFGESGWPSKQ